MDYAFLLLVGFCAATLGGMIGVGGGFLLVPFLCYYWPQATPATITFVSLVMIVCNATSGVTQYARQRRIDYRSGVLFALATVVPAIIGVMIVRRVAMATFAPVFGGMLLLAAVVIARRALQSAPAVAPAVDTPVKPGYVRRDFTDALGVRQRYEFRMRYGIAGSVVAGFCSSFFGIGGGVVHVPVLTQVLRWPPHIATATSNFVLMISATVGVVTHLACGRDLAALSHALAAGAGALAGGTLAAGLARRVSGRFLMLLFAAVQLVIGVRMVLPVVL